MTSLTDKLKAEAKRLKGFYAASHKRTAALLDEAADQILALAEASEWRSMDSAPRDGTAVLGFDGRECVVMAWKETVRWERDRYESTQDKDVSVRVTDVWWEAYAGTVAHPVAWIGLPTPPKEGETG